MNRILKLRREVLIAVVSFIVGLGISYQYNLNRQNGQIDHLITTTRELIGTQRLLISNYHDSFVTLYDCTFEPQPCDLKVGTEKLQLLERGKSELVEKMNKLDGEVEDIIKQNKWADYAKDNQ